MTAPQPAERTPRSFWIGLGVGVVPMMWGAWLYFDATPDLRRRLDLAKWLVGLDLAHDLLLAPIVVGIGYLVHRLVPGRVRAPVQVALILTGAVLLVGWIPLRGTYTGDNETIQPLDYGPSILAVVTMVWLTAAAVVLLRLRTKTSA